MHMHVHTCMHTIFPDIRYFPSVKVTFQTQFCMIGTISFLSSATGWGELEFHLSTLEPFGSFALRYCVLHLWAYCQEAVMYWLDFVSLTQKWIHLGRGNLTEKIPVIRLAYGLLWGVNNFWCERAQPTMGGTTPGQVFLLCIKKEKAERVIENKIEVKIP